MSDLTEFGQWMRAAKRGVAFTGAGISTESGIPDFRGPQGVWNTETPVYYLHSRNLNQAGPSSYVRFRRRSSRYVLARSVRKEGVEPSRELPHRNLNGLGVETSSRNHENSERQKASANANDRHDSGRSGPDLRRDIDRLLNTARHHWQMGLGTPQLRRDLLEVLRRLEDD